MGWFSGCIRWVLGRLGVPGAAAGPYADVIAFAETHDYTRVSYHEDADYGRLGYAETHDYGRITFPE